ncbi:MAG: DUF1990 domain-containing protein [Actinocatenispora sp.]
MTPGGPGTPGGGLTYPEVGATRAASLPGGYRHVRRRVHLGTGPEPFRRVVVGMRDWGIHRGAGVTVRSDAAAPAVGVRFVSTVRLGPFPVAAPCQVVWLDDAPDRFGYGFGTRPGHPERGEESFLVDWTGEDEVWFSIAAFSRPAAWYARLGAAPARLVQDRITERYVAAARRLAAG